VSSSARSPLDLAKPIPWLSTTAEDLGKTSPQLPAVIAVLLALGLVLRLAIAWAPLEWLLRTVLADDSFYYFTIARNFAHGYGFSFDTLAETNGFHPLWVVVLLPIYSLMEERTLAIHAALTVSALLDAGSVLLLFKLLGEIRTAMFARTVAVGLYALTPVLLSHAGPMNGMETSLNVFLIFAYLRQYWTIVSRECFDNRAALHLGILAGLLMLARTDNSVLVAFTWLFLPLFCPSEKKVTHRSILIMLVSAFVVTSPWLLWSLLRFGTIVQVSGVSVPFMVKLEIHQQGWSRVDYVIQFVKNLANTITFFPAYLFETRTLSLPGLIIALTMLIPLVALLRRKRERTGLPRGVTANVHFILLGSAVLFVLVHTLRAVYMRGWYYLSLFPILLICSARLLHCLLENGPRRKVRWLTLISLVMVFVLSVPTLFKSRHGEIDKFRMVQAMNSTLPDGTRVGSGNAGVYGYFFERGIVVGLDGLVNNNAYESIKKRDLEGYCRMAGITHLVDPVGAFERTAWYWNEEQSSPLTTMDVIHRESGKAPTDTIALGLLRYTTTP